MNYMPLTIAIVDDKASNRNILSEKISRNHLLEVLFTAEDGKDFLNKMKLLPTEQLPQVVLMDLEMPNLNGIAAIAAGSSMYPTVKFVVLTIIDDDDKIFKAIKAGAFGYLSKDESADTIAETLWQMYETGAGPVSPGIAFKILQMVQKDKPNTEDKSKSIQFFDLTERERVVLQLLMDGLLYKEIGERLDISANTAKKHVINIYQKLHVNNRAQAMKLAFDKGFISK